MFMLCVMATPIRVAARSVIAAWKPVCSVAKQLSSRFNLKEHTAKPHKFAKHLLSLPLTLILPIMAGVEDNKALIEEVEALYDKKDFQNMYKVLIPHKDTQDPDILWRLARAATEKGKMEGGEARKTHIYEAWDFIKKGLELGPDNFACHKWYGILLDYTGEYEGNKQRIANAYLVKDHFKKAIELNPKDATSMYCLGYWCFLFADMAWYEKKIAAMLFGTPPSSTYEEALKYFEDAERTEPGFYNQNVVMMAKTHWKLKHNSEAKALLVKALEHQDKTADDEKARKEATELLKKL